MLAPVDAVIIGGGFYGLRIALHLREALGLVSVLVLERESELMNRASYVNQARVHNGYHYPRSILTAYRSRVNFPRFMSEFNDAVVASFDHYYAIASKLSKVNARQFELFCSRIGAVIEKAEPSVASWFNSGMIESVYRVSEPAFDSRILRDIILERINSVGGIEIRTRDEVERVESLGELLRVTSSSGIHTAARVINASYSRLNQVHQKSGIPVVPLRHELTEIALVELPTELTSIGLTVMDGPFFSVMPFPGRKLHSLSHVRFTPHYSWYDTGDRIRDPDRLTQEIPESTSFAQMYADALRYTPVLAGMRHEESLWEVKTVLSASAYDDSRPILFKPNHGVRNFTAIMGGKLDNVYDVLEELSLLHARPEV